MTRCDYFRFGSVFIKKSNQTEIIIKKKPKPNRNRVKPTGFGSVFLGEKPVQTGLARFSGLARFFSVSVRFFWFFAYKTETKPNRPVFSKF
jgi:hypothetical protein